MPVTHVKSMDDFLTLMEKSKTNTVVLDFSASWCGPCRYIGPIFEKMSEEYENVVFAKVDVDEISEVSEKCGISAMPTFQFFKNGEKVEEMRGADEAGLRKKLTSFN